MHLIAFASWDIGQYVYCNCLLTRYWCHTFWNQCYLSKQGTFLRDQNVEKKTLISWKRNEHFCAFNTPIIQVPSKIKIFWPSPADIFLKCFNLLSPFRKWTVVSHEWDTWFVSTTRVAFWTWIWPMTHYGLD